MQAIIYSVLKLLFSAYYLLLLARAFMPWIPHDRHNPVLIYVYKSTDVMLKPIGQALPQSRFGIDYSPFIAVILLWVLQKLIMLLLGYLFELAI
jgi:YggT family protein